MQVLSNATLVVVAFDQPRRRHLLGARERLERLVHDGVSLPEHDVRRRGGFCRSIRIQPFDRHHRASVCHGDAAERARQLRRELVADGDTHAVQKQWQWLKVRSGYGSSCCR